jgi:hypothetical protein
MFPASRSPRTREDGSEAGDLFYEYERHTEPMLEISKLLDIIIMTLQKQGENEIRAFPGQSFEQGGQNLNAWLSRRAGN